LIFFSSHQQTFKSLSATCIVIYYYLYAKQVIFILNVVILISEKTHCLTCILYWWILSRQIYQTKLYSPFPSQRISTMSWVQLG